MALEYVCWKCGATLAELPQPLSRLAECPKCRAYLHVCRLCKFHDPRLTRACREQDAEEVIDKEHANFCAYFKIQPGAYRIGSNEKAQTARDQLSGLFGTGPKSTKDSEG